MTFEMPSPLTQDRGKLGIGSADNIALSVSGPASHLVFSSAIFARPWPYRRSQLEPQRPPKGNIMMAPNPLLASPVSRAPSSKTWDPKEILQIIDQKTFDERNPYLRLDVKAIRDRRKSFKPATPLSTPERPGKQVRRDTTRAICALTIWEGSGPDVLVQDQVFCTIASQTRETSGERFARIDLEEPFKVLPRQLVPKSGRSLAAQRYSMQIALQAAEVNGRWPPIDLDKIPNPERPVVRDTIEGTENRFPFLVTSYSRLPQVPSKDDEALLPLTALQDEKQYTPKLSLQIDARWVESTTVSEQVNARERLESQKCPEKETEHEAADTKEEAFDARHKVETTWSVRNFVVEEHVFSGYVCPLCNNRTFQGSDVYWFHLLQNHDLFRFRVHVKYPDGRDESKKIAVHVKVGIKDRRDGRKSLDDGHFMTSKQRETPKDITVLNTYRSFFDLQEYLREEREKYWPKGRVDRRSYRIPGSSANETQRTTPTLPDLTRPASQVPDLPVRPTRRRHPVPPAPNGVTFFSLRVKRPLEEGEELSESDDDIDDEWVLQKHNDRIEGFDLSREEKCFIKRHDRHMLLENINSNLHYREALVRFCRLNHEWLRQPSMRREFCKKLTGLHLEGVIKLHHILEFLDIVGEARKDGPDLGLILAEPRETGTALLPTEDAGPLYATCERCGGGIHSLKEVFRCSNPMCANDYHVRCAKPGSNASSDQQVCHECLGGQPEEKPKLPEVQAAKDSMVIDLTDRATPEPHLLNKFADDHLSRMPNPHRAMGRLNVVPASSEGSSSRPIMLGVAAGTPLAGSEDEGPTTSESLTTADNAERGEDFPVGHDMLRRLYREKDILTTTANGLGAIDEGMLNLKELRQKRRREKKVQKNQRDNAKAIQLVEHQLALQAREEQESQRRMEEEKARRITDENSMTWIHERPIRPRRPHEL